MENQKRQITLAELFSVLRRFWLLILLCTVVFAALGYLFAKKAASATYTATSGVYVQMATVDISVGPTSAEIAQARAMAQSCQEAIYNDNLYANVRRYFAARRLDSPTEGWEDLSTYTNQNLQGMIRAKVEQSSQNLTVTVEAPSASLAVHLANAVAGELEASVTDIIGNCRIEPIATADAAARQGASTRPLTAALGLVGALGSYFVLFCLVFFDKRVRDTEELSALLGKNIPLLGTLPDRGKEKNA